MRLSKNQRDMKLKIQAKQAYQTENYNGLYPVADPGFSPGGGRQLPKVLLFFNFLPKTA